MVCWVGVLSGYVECVCRVLGLLSVGVLGVRCVEWVC